MQDEQRRILITGATGHLGRAVVEHLANKVAADRIIAFVRDEGKAADLRARGVKICVGDYDDVPSLDRAMVGAEKVLLVSGTADYRIQQHQNVVDAAKRAGVRMIAYTSRVVKEKDTSDNPLMVAHFAAEDSIKESGLDYALIRNALYMDNIPLFVGGEKVFEAGITLPTGDGRVSYALRRELGEAIANLLAEDSPESRVYELTAGEAWSFYDVATALTKLSGRAVAYTPISPSAFMEWMRGQGLPEPMIQGLADFLSEIRNRRLDGVSPQMEQLLGRRPVSLKEGLKILFNL